LEQLEALTRDAVALAQGATATPSPGSAAQSELARQLQICNACRYCEGFCAVFPAMTRRLDFGSADLHYLANLCHNCGACLHACQYAPPHAFAVSIPKAMAQVRVQTYADYAWPPALGSLYQRNGLTLSLALAGATALFLLLTLAFNQTLWGGPAIGNFYRLFPHNLLIALFAPVLAWSVLALVLGLRRFWRDLTPVTSGQPVHAQAALEAGHDALSLRYLGGGHGQGCNEEDDAFSTARRRAHHLTFYGFVLCFASTSVATFYHYALDRVAPYELPSLPKLLGVAGGIGLLVGSAALARLALRRNPQHADAAQRPMDLGFIALLFLTSLSGMALWLARSAPAMPVLLALHLGAVMALFATLPYGKFAHGVYRSAALLRHAVEKRQPNPVAPAAD